MKKTLIALTALLLAAAAEAQLSVRCESSDGKYVECRTNSLNRVTLSRQLSDTSCVEGKTWGFRDNVVWVDRGCRAEFAVAGMAYGTPVAADKLVVCESLNNGRHTCRADIKGGVTLTRQLSDNACIRGKSWGINQRGIWVDQGCRAEFAMGTAVTDRYRTPSNTQMLVCESRNGNKTRCPVDTSMGVRLTKRTSDHACALGRDWGYDENGIWVTNGCRAEFTVSTSGYSPMTSAASRPAVLCESKDGRRSLCPADTTFGVTLSRQLSDNDCIRNQTWGYDSGGIWVTKGCRAEFVLDTVR